MNEAFSNVDEAVKNRILEIGKLTGWRKFRDGSYGPLNFERGLLLRHLVQTYKPLRILEVGTGRGFGPLVMSETSKQLGLQTSIDTIDLYSPDDIQEWVIHREGKDEVLHTSIRSIWNAYFQGDIQRNIQFLTGSSHTILPRLLRQGNTYDLIFIDGGHSPYSVVHDLAYAHGLLSDGGLILMDDFAPLQKFGLGTVVAYQHAIKYFNSVRVVVTEGLVYGHAMNPDFPKAMLLVHGRRPATSFRTWKFLIWRILNPMLRLAVSKISVPIKIAQ